MTDLSLSAWIILAGFLGLVLGSFLNVVILRLPRRLEAQWKREARDMLELPADGDHAVAMPPGIVRKPSHCLHCKHRLSIQDTIPLLSWLLLRGHCRYCKKGISAQYPLVEMLNGVLSAMVVWRFGLSWMALAGLGFTWTLIALAGIDVRSQLLPDAITLTLLWFGLLLSILPMFVTAPSAIIGAVIGYLSLWSVYWLFKLVTGKEGMGHGDFKLLAALGAWMGPSALLPIILLSSLGGLLMGGSLIVLHRHKRHMPIAFGPFIAGAGWLWFILGTPILNFLNLSDL